MDDDEGNGAVPQETLKSCLDKFGSPDFIMEPEIFSQLKKYFQSGGNPEQVDILSEGAIKDEKKYLAWDNLSAEAVWIIQI